MSASRRWNVEFRPVLRAILPGRELQLDEVPADAQESQLAGPLWMLDCRCRAGIRDSTGLWRTCGWQSTGFRRLLSQAARGMHRRFGADIFLFLHRCAGAMDMQRLFSILASDRHNSY